MRSAVILARWAVALLLGVLSTLKFAHARLLLNRHARTFSMHRPGSVAHFGHVLTAQRFQTGVSWTLGAHRANGSVPAMRRRLVATMMFVLYLNIASTALLAQTDNPCPNPPLALVNGTDVRPRVEGDYLVIEYNARSLQTFWHDYHHRLEAPMRIDRNGSFIPVVYTKEKIAVHVCNLNFGDLLTVTTSPLGTPEGGADIRGTTPAPIPSLTSTLDALQSGASTGGNTPVSSLGFAATAALGSTTVSGVSPGTLVYDEAG